MKKHELQSKIIETIKENVETMEEIADIIKSNFYDFADFLTEFIDETVEFMDETMHKIIEESTIVLLNAFCTIGDAFDDIFDPSQDWVPFLPTVYWSFNSEAHVPIYSLKGTFDVGVFIQLGSLPDIRGGLFACFSGGVGPGGQLSSSHSLGMQFAHPNNIAGKSLTVDVDGSGPTFANFGMSMGKTYTGFDDFFKLSPKDIDYNIDFSIGAAVPGGISGALMNDQCWTTKTVSSYKQILNIIDPLQMRKVCPGENTLQNLILEKLKIGDQHHQRPLRTFDFSDESPVTGSQYELHGGARLEQAPGFPPGQKALRISGSRQYAKIPDVNISHSKMNHCTIAISLYLDSITGKGWVVSHDNGNYDRAIVMHDSRFGGMGLAVGSTKKFFSGSGKYPTTKKWIQVVAVFRQGGECEFYLDGVKAPQTHEGRNDNGTEDLYIGSVHGHHDHHIDGWIKGVRLYDYALTNADVKKLHNEFKAEFRTA